MIKCYKVNNFTDTIYVPNFSSDPFKFVKILITSRNEN
jgi:hypothetical protein